MTVHAVPVVDRLERDGRTLLLLERQVVELSPLGLAAYDAASEPLTVAELTEVLVGLFGSPPEGDPSEGVQRLVDELVGLGLLQST